LLIGQLIGLPASSAALALLVVRRHQARVTRTQFCWYLVEADKTNKNWFPWQRPFGNRKANFRSFIYSRSSIDPAQLVKIVRGRVHVEIIGLTEIVKINMKRRQNTSPPWAAAASSGRTNEQSTNAQC